MRVTMGLKLRDHNKKITWSFNNHIYLINTDNKVGVSHLECWRRALSNETKYAYIRLTIADAIYECSDEPYLTLHSLVRTLSLDRTFALYPATRVWDEHRPPGFGSSVDIRLLPVIIRFSSVLYPYIVRMLPMNCGRIRWVSTFKFAANWRG